MIFQKPHVELTSSLDFNRLAVLFQEIANRTPAAFFNWTQATALDEIQRAKNFAIQENDEIQAFVTFRVFADRLEIMALGTKPMFSKKGFGQKICAMLKKYANYHKLPIWLEVHERNQSAIALYLKSGFTMVQKRKGYYQDGGSALVMTYRES